LIRTILFSNSLVRGTYVITNDTYRETDMTLARTSLHSVVLGLGFVAGSASAALAVPVYNETVVHNTTTTVDVTLDSSTVLCSAADYGATFLKILIPDLGKITLLDHQNTGAGAPCVASGPCQPGNEPSDIIDVYDPNETVQVNVQAIRGDESDADTQLCTTYLTEKVKVTIRGKDFFHERFAQLGTRPYSDCVTSQAQPEPEPEPEPEETGSGKSDIYGQPNVEEPSGGCNATGGAGSTSLAGLLLGLAAITRRRRR
jgi:uncharacterized protein (TIGR03382 family)